ncbi:MAG: hypothetical protein BWY69_00551 [Planctomycetes bacterium ADurb.Bin401]|nr:MAG: hypothetical protein BWY69_00551 [Planctomycetes bacterium ADurb.Bin401]
MADDCDFIFIDEVESEQIIDAPRCGESSAGKSAPVAIGPDAAISFSIVFEIVAIVNAGDIPAFNRFYSPAFMERLR